MDKCGVRFERTNTWLEFASTQAKHRPHVGLYRPVRAAHGAKYSKTKAQNPRAYLYLGQAGCNPLLRDSHRKTLELQTLNSPHTHTCASCSRLGA